jgi:hypothetical protein
MNQLKDLLDIDEKYLFDQVAENITTNYTQNPDTNKYAVAQPFDGPWRWGLGSIYASLKFPTSLAGSTDRLPDRYHKLVYATGRPIPDELLKNTNEMVHASVRARYEYGRSWNSKTYQSGGLAGWERGVKTNDDGTTVAIWTFKGKDDAKVVGPWVMEEAPLGDLEKAVLARDQNMMTNLFPVKDNVKGQ